MDDTQVMDYTQELETESDDYDIKNSVVAFLEIDQHKYELKRGTMKLGRDPSMCKIVIENQKTLSKEHAVFEVDSHSVTLSDLGSRNKTRIGKLVLKPHIIYALQGGEHLKFGAVKGHFTMNVKVSDTDSDACSESMLDISSSEGRSTTGIDDSIISPTPLVSSKNIHEVGKAISSKKSLDFIPETPAVACASSSTSEEAGTIVMESPASQSTPMGPSAGFKNFLTPTSPVQFSPITTKQPWNSLDLDASFPQKDNFKLEGSFLKSSKELNYHSDESTDEEDVFDEQSKSNVDAPPPRNQSNEHNGIEDSLNDDTQDIFQAFNESPESKMHKSADNTQDILEAFEKECDMEDNEIRDGKSELFDRTNSGTLFKRPLATPLVRKAKVSSKSNLPPENDIFDAPTQVYVPPIVSSTDEKEDPSEMPTQKFSMSYLTDEVFDAPTQVFDAPTQVFDAPTQVFDAPMQVFDAPTQVFDAPTQVFDAPTQVFDAPTQAFEAPTQVFQAPTQVFEAPTQIFEAPTASDTPTQVFEHPTVSDTPTQVFEHPTVSDVPTQVFEPSTLSDAPTQVIEASTLSDTPTQVFDAPTQLFEVSISDAPTQVLSNTTAFDSLDEPTQVLEAPTQAFNEPRQTLNSPTQAHVPSTASDLTSPTPGNCSIDSNEPTQVFMMDSPFKDKFECKIDDTHLADTVILDNSQGNILEIEDMLSERTNEHSLVTCASNSPVKGGKDDAQSKDLYIKMSKEDNDSDSTISEPLLEQTENNIDETIKFNDYHLIPQSGKENCLNTKKQTKQGILDTVEKISIDDMYTNKISHKSQASLVETDQTNENLDAKDCQGENQEENSENFLLNKNENSKPLNSQVLSEEKLVDYNSDASTDIEDVDEQFNSNLQNNLSTPLSVKDKPDKSQEESDISKLELSSNRTQPCKVFELMNDNKTEKNESDTCHKTPLNAIKRDALKTPLQNSNSETPVLDYSYSRYVDKLTIACPESSSETKIQNEASFLINTSPPCSHSENEAKPDSVDNSKLHLLFSPSESDGESIKKSKRTKKKQRKSKSPVKGLDFTHLEDVKENKGNILELSNSAELDCNPTLTHSSQSPQKSADLSHSPIFKDSKVLPNRPEAKSDKKPGESVLDPSMNELLKSGEPSKVPNSNCEAPIQSLEVNLSMKSSPSTSIELEENPVCSKASPVGSEPRSRIAMTTKGNTPIITHQKNKKSQTNSLSISVKQEHMASCLLSLKSTKKQSDSKRDDNTISKDRIVKTKLTVRCGKIPKDCEEAMKSLKLKRSLRGSKKVDQESEEIREADDVNLVAIKETSIKPKRLLRDIKKVDQELEEIREADDVNLVAIKETSIKPKRLLRDIKKVDQESEEIKEADDVILGAIKEPSIKPKRLSRDRKKVDQESEEIREADDVNLVAIKETSIKAKRLLRDIKKVDQESEEIREAGNLVAIKETSIKPKRLLRDSKKVDKESEEIRETEDVNLVAIKETSIKPKRLSRDSKKVNQEWKEIREIDDVNLVAIKKTSIKPKRLLQDIKKVDQVSEEIREADDVNLVAIKETSIKPNRLSRDSKKVNQERKEIREIDDVNLVAIKKTSIKPKRLLQDSKKVDQESEEVREAYNLVVIEETSIKPKRLLQDSKKVDQDSKEIREADDVNLVAIKETIKAKRLLQDSKKVDQELEEIREANNLIAIKDTSIKTKRLLPDSKKVNQESEEIRQADDVNLVAIKETSIKPKRLLRGNRKVGRQSEEIKETDNVNLVAIKETSIKPKQSLQDSKKFDQESEENKDADNVNLMAIKETLKSKLTLRGDRNICKNSEQVNMKDAEVKNTQPTHESLLAAKKRPTSCRRKSTVPFRYSPSEDLPSNKYNGGSHRSKRTLDQVEDSSISFSKVKKTSEQTCKSLTEQDSVSQLYGNSSTEVCSDHNAASNKRKKLFKEEKNPNLTCKRRKLGESEDVATNNLKRTRTRTTHSLQAQIHGMEISDPGEAKASSRLQCTKNSRISKESDTLDLSSKNLSLLSSPQSTKIENTKEIGVSSTMGKMDENQRKPRSSGRTRGKKQTYIEEESEMEICFMSDSSQNSSHHSTRGRMQRPKSSRSKRSEASPRCSREEILWSPSQRQALANKRPRVLFTGFKDPKDEKVVKDSGGLLVETATECSVLVTNAIKRTCKFIACLAKGIPIVSREWISASKIAGNLVDPWKYFVVDKEAEKKFGFSLKKSLEVASKRRLLTGYSIYVTDSVKPPPDEMKEIVACAGGEFLENPPVFGSPKTIIISCPADKKLWTRLKKLKIAIVNTEFILTGLLKQKILIDENKLA